MNLEIRVETGFKLVRNDIIECEFLSWKSLLLVNTIEKRTLFLNEEKIILILMSCEI
jgi:hypothetical protein